MHAKFYSARSKNFEMHYSVISKNDLMSEYYSGKIRDTHPWYIVADMIHKNKNIVTANYIVYINTAYSIHGFVGDLYDRDRVLRHLMECFDHIMSDNNKHVLKDRDLIIFGIDNAITSNKQIAAIIKERIDEWKFIAAMHHFFDVSNVLRHYRDIIYLYPNQASKRIIKESILTEKESF